MGFAVEAFFAVVFTRLYADEADIQPCVAIGSEAECARDVDTANDAIGVLIVDDVVARANEDAGARPWNMAAFPCGTG